LLRSICPQRLNLAVLQKVLLIIFYQRCILAVRDWDKAIAAATAVIDGGQYSLMQQNQRFGKYRDSLGTNIFWDLFREGNYNAAANREDIWVVQFEVGTPGGGASTGIGNNYHRGLARWFDTKDPNNANGMLSPVTTIT
jgi:hypothetical protein